jgi:hypothetical protein
LSGILARQTAPGPLAPEYTGMPGLDPAAGLEPGEPAPGEPAPGGPAPAEGADPAGPTAEKPPDHPAWMTLDSDQDTLPGDPVPALLGINRAYSEDDRIHARIALTARLAENKPRAHALTREVPESVLEVWTGFVTESMEKASKADEGWPWYAKLLSFGARAVLMAVLFPESIAEEAAESLAAELYEKGMEFALEQASDKISEAAVESKTETKVEKEVSKLEKLSVSAAAMISGSLGPVMDQMSDGVYYDRWLTQAPLEQLGLFRVPPLVPEPAPDHLRATVAQAMAGLAHDQESVAVEPGGDFGFFDDNSHDRITGDENMLVIKLHAGAAGRIEVQGASFAGSKALGHAMKGAALKDLPNVPMLITFTASEGDELGPIVADMEAISTVNDAYPSKSPATIKRYADGLVAVDEGGLAEHFHLYQRVEVGADLGELMLDSMKGMNEPVSPERPPSVVAKELWQTFWPALPEGAELMLLESVGDAVLGQ